MAAASGDRCAGTDLLRGRPSLFTTPGARGPRGSRSPSAMSRDTIDLRRGFQRYSPQPPSLARPAREPVMASEWYYTQNGQQAPSPVSSSQLAQLAGSGQLQPTDMVWREGMPNWVAASSIKGLFGTP